MIARTLPARLRQASLALWAALTVGAPPALAAPPVPALTALVNARVAATGFSGTIVVRHGGSELYAGAFGQADRAFEVPARVDTRYRVASVTKLFTATVVMQLRDEGKIDLDAPVSRYLPTYSGNGAERVPIVNLLNHTSGLPNMDMVATYEQALRDGLPAYQTPRTPAEIVKRYANGPLVRPTGTGFDYNNADYMVLGQVIEAVTRQSFAEAVRARILAPLDLRDTGMPGDGAIVARLAGTYYRPDPAGGYVDDLPVYWENLYAAGGMYSSARDLAAFAEALYGGRLVQPGSLALMLKPGMDDYGYGQWIRTFKVGGVKRLSAERYGSAQGANAILFEVLGEDLTVVIVSNTNAVAPTIGDFAADIATAVLEAKR